MKRDVLTQKQATALVFLYTIGTVIVMGTSLKAEQDTWIATLLAVAASCPVFYVYGRIHRLYPEQSLYDLFPFLFGKVAGKILTAIFTWYAFHLGVLVMRNFTEYIHIVSLIDTPQTVNVILMMLLTIFAVRSGTGVLGRYALIAAPVLITLLAVVTVLAVPLMQSSNLLPIFDHNSRQIAAASADILAFPLAESVLFLCVFDALRTDASPYKVYRNGAVLLGGGMILAATFRNILALGFPLLSSLSFPTHITASIISLGVSLSRFEILISANFMLSGFVKQCICLLAASKGLAGLFGIKEYQKLILPVGLLTMAVTGIVYDSFGQMVEWMSLYKYYALPFQLGIPVAVLIAAERKHRKSSLAAQALR